RNQNLILRDAAFICAVRDGLALARPARAPRLLRMRESALFPVAKPAIDGAQHVAIVVSPDPLTGRRFRCLPLLDRRELADIGLLARGDHDIGCEDVFAVAAGILVIDPALQAVGIGNADYDARQFEMPVRD